MNPTFQQSSEEPRSHPGEVSQGLLIHGNNRTFIPAAVSERIQQVQAAEFPRAGWGGPGGAVSSRGSPLEGNVDPPAASFPAAPPAPHPAPAR